MASILLAFVFTILQSFYAYPALNDTIPRGRTKFRASFIHINAHESPMRNLTASPEEIRQMDWQISKQRAMHLYRINRGHPIASESMQSETEIMKSSFIMRFQIGNPRIESYGYIDTGSALSWVQCKPCEVCYEQRGEIYDPDNSDTYESVAWSDIMCSMEATGTTIFNLRGDCYYSLKYLDGSRSQGNLARDEFSFDGGFLVNNFLFGCSWANNRTDYSPPGLIGLGKRPSSLIRQLEVRQFGYYVESKSRRTGDNEWVTNMGGVIEFGNDEDEIIDPDATIKLLPDDTFYYLALKNITVGGIPLNATYEHGIVIDSGATVTCFSADIFRELQRKIIKAMGAPAHGMCYRNIYKSPKFVFSFERPGDGTLRYDLELCPSSLWSDRGLVYCLEIDICPKLSRSVLGMYQQRGLKVGYDIEQGVVSISEMVKNTCPSNMFSRA